MRVHCVACRRRCKGEVLRIQQQYVHRDCFKCSMCSVSLENSGFFVRDSKLYCPDDYQRQFGVSCRICGSFVVGEVITALGCTFHPACFKCQSCDQAFAAGDRVTLWSNDQYLCKVCTHRERSKENAGDNGCQMAPSDSDISQKAAVNGRHVLTNGQQLQEQQLQVGTEFAGSTSTPVNRSLVQHSPGSVSCPSDTGSRRSRFTTCFGAHAVNSFLDIQQEAEKRTHVNDRYRRAPSVCSSSSPKPQHFHLPSSKSQHSGRALSTASSLYRSFVKPTASLSSRRAASVGGRRTPRSCSPAPDDDPVLLSLYPGGSRPDVTQPAPVERDNWPAPAFCELQATDRQRKHREHQREGSDSSVVKSQPARNQRKSASSSRLQHKLEEGGIELGELGNALLQNGHEQQHNGANGHSRSVSEDDSNMADPTIDSIRQRQRGYSNGTVSKSSSLTAQGKHSNGWDNISYPELLGLRPTGLSRLNYNSLLRCPPKQYSLQQLLLRPKGVDSTRLEDHLVDDEFGNVFGMDRRQWRLEPQWRKNELKQRVGLL